MNKLKVLSLCIASSVLTVVLMLGFPHINLKSESQLIVKGSTDGGIAEFQAQVTKPSWFLSKTLYQWKVLNNKGVIQHRVINSSDILFPTGTNDKFWVLTSVVNHYNYILWSEVVPLDIVVTPVVVGPAPTPGPMPVPTPTPAPVTIPLFAMAVFDNNAPLALTENQFYLHNNTTDMQNSLKALNITWKNYDKQNPALANPTWQSLIQKWGTPALFIVDGAGKTYYQGQLISKIDTMDRINRIRGIN